MKKHPKPRKGSRGPLCGSMTLPRSLMPGSGLAGCIGARGLPGGAARATTRIALDYIDFRNESAVANGWLQRAHRLLEKCPQSPETLYGIGFLRMQATRP